MSEQVLALPQLGGDGDVEVSGEFMVAEGSLASRLEKKKGQIMGARLAWTSWPWDISVGWPFLFWGRLGGAQMASLPSL